jgi:hypothetical protein
MACRLFNRSAHVLSVDLRGGAVLQLAPGATSEAMREELLYDNLFLPQWEREGLIARLPARFEEVLVREGGVAKEQAKPSPQPQAQSDAEPQASERRKAAKKSAASKKRQSS